MNSLVDVLRTRAHEVPERVAYTFLVDGEAEAVTLTYGELDQQARSIAEKRRLLELVPSGSVFPAVAALMCAAWVVGAVPLPCQTGLPCRRDRTPSPDSGDRNTGPDSRRRKTATV